MHFLLVLLHVLNAKLFVGSGKEYKELEEK